MADIKPFRGIRYNPAVAGKPRHQRVSAVRHDHPGVATRSVRPVRIQHCPAGVGKAAARRRPLCERRRIAAAVDDIQGLTRDDEPSVYVTEERFSFRGNEYVRRASSQLYGSRNTTETSSFRHEYTRQEWVLDRVRLMGVAGANYSSLLVLFRDDLRSTVGGILRAVAGGKPTDTAAPPDMPELRMWRLSDPGTIEVLAKSFADSQLFIADGHHRYEAALRFREQGAQRTRGRSRRVDQLPDDDARVGQRAGLVTRGYHRTIQNASAASCRPSCRCCGRRTTLTSGDAEART